ncbi:hypothetical protein OSCI_3850016 [Kamptonema sp. PCC 6506]|nr:hypothetical protein OSCI_3850016 [Kamptonema sp. PCC 6506]
MRKSWTETLGKEPTDKDFALISQIFWNNETSALERYLWLVMLFKRKNAIIALLRLTLKF